MRFQFINTYVKCCTECYVRTPKCQMVFYYWPSLISSVFLRCKININIPIFFVIIHLTLQTSILDTRFGNNLKVHLGKQTCLLERPRHSTICPVFSKEVLWSPHLPPCQALRWEGCLNTRLLGDFFVWWLFTLVTVDGMQIILNPQRSCWVTLMVYTCKPAAVTRRGKKIKTLKIPNYKNAKLNFKYWIIMNYKWKMITCCSCDLQ